MSATTMPRAGRSAARRVQPQRVPRRVSGPATGRAGVRPSPQRAPTVGARALSVVRSLPDHSLIDRLVRGRAWIPVLGVLLAGIVATQVEILKLGTSLGRSLERTSALQGTNEALQANIASLDDAARIERLGARMGLVMPSASLMTFLSARPQDQLGKAIANIHAPDPAGFALQLESQLAAAALQAPPATTPSSGTTSGAGTTSSAAGQSTGVAASSTSTGSTATTTATSTTTTGTTTAAGPTNTTTTTPTTATGTTTGGTGTGSTTTGVATAGGGASAGGAGLPATSSSQSGTTPGG